MKRIALAGLAIGFFALGAEPALAQDGGEAAVAAGTSTWMVSVRASPSSVPVSVSARSVDRLLKRWPVNLSWLATFVPR